MDQFWEALNNGKWECISHEDTSDDWVKVRYVSKLYSHLEFSHRLSRHGQVPAVGTVGTLNVVFNWK